MKPCCLRTTPLQPLPGATPQAGVWRSAARTFSVSLSRWVSLLEVLYSVKHPRQHFIPKIFLGSTLPPMPNVRSAHQAVHAVSLSRDLLLQARRRAVEYGMTISGYFRYCLAIELGYSQRDARELAQHQVIAKSARQIQYPAKADQAVALNEPSSTLEQTATSIAKHQASKVASRPLRKPSAGGQSGPAAGPKPASGKG